MQLAVYCDGRQLNFDDSTLQFAIGDAVVTPDQVRGYDAAGQLAWANPDQRNWFHQHFVASPIATAPAAPSKKRKMGFVVGLVALGLLTICGIAAIGSGGKSTDSSGGGGTASGVKTTPVSNNSKEEQKAPQPRVGHAFKTDNLEITILAVDTKSAVGTEFLQSKPAEGGVYVAVRWKYKNVSSKPIGMFSQPRLKLVDSTGTEYSPDTGASVSYSTELKLTEKVVSDLNPGITVTAADVFEVSKTSFDKSKWSVGVKGDQDVTVPLK